MGLGRDALGQAVVCVLLAGCVCAQSPTAMQSDARAAAPAELGSATQSVNGIGGQTAR